jgi:hypothetical protein
MGFEKTPFQGFVQAVFAERSSRLPARVSSPGGRLVAVRSGRCGHSVVFGVSELVRLWCVKRQTRIPRPCPLVVSLCRPPTGTRSSLRRGGAGARCRRRAERRHGPEARSERGLSALSRVGRRESEGEEGCAKRPRSLSASRARELKPGGSRTWWIVRRCLQRPADEPLREASRRPSGLGAAASRSRGPSPRPRRSRGSSSPLGERPCLGSWQHDRARSKGSPRAAQRSAMSPTWSGRTCGISSSLGPEGCP